MFLDKFEEILLGKFVLFFVQIITGEEEIGILLGQTGHIGLDLRILPALLETFDSEDTTLAHALLFTTI